MDAHGAGTSPLFLSPDAPPKKDQLYFEGAQPGILLAFFSMLLICGQLSDKKDRI